MSTSAGTADTATGGVSGLQAFVYTSPMHEFDGARGTFSPTTSTLIVGQREAVLIDAQFMASDVAALGTVVPGDVVYNRIHVMMALSTPDEWQQWLASIDTVEALSPRSIIAGHKAPDVSDEDVRGMLDGTRTYIRDFAAAAPEAKDAEQLIAVMLEKHPECGNPWTLQYSANAWFQRKHEGDS